MVAKNDGYLTGVFDDSPKLRAVERLFDRALRHGEVNGLFDIRDLRKLDIKLLRRTSKLLGIGDDVNDDQLLDLLLNNRESSMSTYGTSQHVNTPAYDIPARSGNEWYGNEVPPDEISSTVVQSIPATVLIVGTKSVARPNGRMAGIGAYSIINPSCNVMYGYQAYFSGNVQTSAALSWKKHHWSFRTSVADNDAGVVKSVYGTVLWPANEDVNPDGFRFYHGALPVLFANRGRAIFAGIDPRPAFLRADSFRDGEGAGFSDGQGGLILLGGDTLTGAAEGATSFAGIQYADIGR